MKRRALQGLWALWSLWSPRVLRVLVGPALAISLGCLFLLPAAFNANAADAAASGCRPDPFAARALYLRGSFNTWSADDAYRFRWRCNKLELVVGLSGEHVFKVGDDSWSADADYGAAPGAAPGLPSPLALRGGNLNFRFAGGHALSISFDGDRPQLTVAPAVYTPAVVVPAVTDPVALSLRFDSRSGAHKSPFGAVRSGSSIGFQVDSAASIDSVTLVIESRRLEGNQDLLEYREIARVPLVRGAGQRWAGRYRFIAPGVYGYWFEARAGQQTWVYQNNAEPVFWTREKGSGGVGAAAPSDTAVRNIRRFRQTVFDPAFKVPSWAPDVVWYQIFPDSFRNGDTANDPQPGRDRYQGGGVELHKSWLDKRFKPGTGDGSDALFNNDFFGGDIAGIMQKLDDLKDLGVNTLYMTPVFLAPSNHKYDTADYTRIDPAFGNNADFKRLTAEAAKRGMRVVPDASFNHTGADSIYFDRYGNFTRNGKSDGAFAGGKPNPASPYFSWYRFDTTQADADRQYIGWGGPDLPELDKASPAFRKFAYGTPGGAGGITQQWLDLGAAGWRMDVAPWVPDDFWREWRSAVKRHRPDALTVAETWFDASKYLVGDMFDSTMNYIFRNTVLDYAGGGKATALVGNLEHLREAYPPQALYALMNLLGSHDVARALHVLGGPETADAAAMAVAKQRLKLATLMQMSWPGAPLVYYGDEVGMTGGDDPYNRNPYPWPDLGGKPDLALRAEFKRLIQMRHQHPVLRRGSVQAPVFVDEQVMVFVREHKGVRAITAFNNSSAPRTVRVVLPAGFKQTRTWRDALGGEAVKASRGQVDITVPALFGRVMISP